MAKLIVLICLLLAAASAYVRPTATTRKFLTSRTPFLLASSLERPRTKSPGPSITDDLFIEAPGGVKEMVSVSDAEFDEEVVQAQGLQVVLFTSHWCNPCRNMANTLKSEVMPKHGSKCSFYSVDCDDSSIASDLNVRSIPSCVFIKDGKVVSEIVGNAGAELVCEQIIKHF